MVNQLGFGKSQILDGHLRDFPTQTKHGAAIKKQST